jgi:hypothetical protein
LPERIVWLLASLAGVVLLVLSLWPLGLLPNHVPVLAEVTTEDVAPVDPLAKAIRLAVFNGCGDSQVAARMTKRARSLGFDVIHEGNAESFNYLYSVVLDRSGDMDKAREVALRLGIPFTIQQINEDDYRLEEVSVIVGKDYKRLKLLEVTSG